MSKIGRKPIIIPEGVEVKIQDGVLELKGKNGSLKVGFLDGVTAKVENNLIKFASGNDSKQGRANWGTTAALVRNAVLGVTDGFTKILEIEGVGFRASMEGNDLVLSVGFTHPVKYVSPEGIKISLEKNAIKIFGIDKALVGQVAAEIRKIKKPEPYKGRGIRYRGEIIRRKVGKKVAGAGAK